MNADAKTLANCVLDKYITLATLLSDKNNNSTNMLNVEPFNVPNTDEIFIIQF